MSSEPAACPAHSFFFKRREPNRLLIDRFVSISASKLTSCGVSDGSKRPASLSSLTSRALSVLLFILRDDLPDLPDLLLPDLLDDELVGRDGVTGVACGTVGEGIVVESGRPDGVVAVAMTGVEVESRRASLFGAPAPTPVAAAAPLPTPAAAALSMRFLAKLRSLGAFGSTGAGSPVPNPVATCRYR